VLLAISNALLFDEPSMYSEKSKSVAAVPPLVVVVEMVVLFIEIFHAAYFEIT
jgi:hypothetical protein